MNMCSVLLGLLVYSFFFFCNYPTLVAGKSGGVYSQEAAWHSYFYAFGSYCPLPELQAWNCYWCANVSDFEVSFVLQENHLLAFVGYDPTTDQTVVAFRGSRDIENWISDFTLYRVDYPGVEGGTVHKGFYSDWTDTLQGRVMRAVAAEMKAHPTSDVLLTGHSLGAAFAQLAAMEVRQLVTDAAAYDDVQLLVYHFGSPRWANDVLAAYYDTTVDETWRIVNKRDIVPVLPQVPQIVHGYQHTKHQIWYKRHTSPLTFINCDDTSEEACGILLPNPIDHTTYMGVNKETFFICYIGGLVDTRETDRIEL